MKNLGKLVLTSGGYLDGQRTPECDEMIENLVGKGKVLIVDNATITGSNKSGPKGVEDNFLKNGNDVEIVTLTSDNIEIIDEFDSLYFAGGDVTPLIKLASSEHVKNAIMKFLQNGGNIIGESAGSIIFCQDTKYYYDVKRGTKAKYDVVLPSYKGFGFCENHIYPHWNKAKPEQINKVMMYELSTGVSIDRLEDGEWIEVDLIKKKLNEDIDEMDLLKIDCITSGNTSAIVSKKGGQLVSFKVDGVECMFQGARDKKERWNKSAPNLFNPGPTGDLHYDSGEPLPHVEWINGEPRKNNEGKTLYLLIDESKIKRDENGKYFLDKKNGSVFKRDREGFLISYVFDNGKFVEYIREDKKDPKTYVEYNLDGGLYYAGQHGHIQNFDMNVRGKGDDYIVYSLRESDGTYEEFPYKYTYYLEYVVGDNGKLSYTSRVQNNDDKPMLAGMGWHPAFQLHMGAERYGIRFTNVPENAESKKIGNSVYNISIDVVPVSEVVCYGKGIVLQDLKGATATIVYLDDKLKEIPYISMDISDDVFLLWSKEKTNLNQQDFVCMEVWNTTPGKISQLTTRDKTGKLSEEIGARIINPSEMETLSTELIVHDEYLKEMKNYLSNDNVERV